MISFIKGELVSVKEDKIIVEAGGIGYNIFVPTSLLPNLPQTGSEVKIYTYLNVREDAMNLFGFLNEDDLDMYKMLLGVNGVGPKAALGVLSNISANDLRIAIVSDDAKTIAKAPGLGNKTAQKIILELKSKIDLEATLGNIESDASIPAGINDDDRNEAVQALTALGYSASESMKAVRKVPMDVKGADAILKQALKNLF
ncbi:MAG: Holliday junction branch migration protein RuvA [Lachnospiraceae bacterium]|nr:Holliday junction branch migration protein RuvA [Lachnospiraceae bacterium]